MTDIERKKLEELVAKVFTLAYELGTNVDELFREVRQLRFETKDKDFEAALINLEHTFFMIAQSINILKDQTRNTKLQPKKLLKENTELKVNIKGFEVLDDGEIKYLEDILTPLILVENIPNYKENVFWYKIRNLWVLVGKIPPLTIESSDVILFKEKGKWGLFKIIEKKDNMLILTDGKGLRKTKVKEENLTELNLLGKVLRVQNKV